MGLVSTATVLGSLLWFSPNFRCDRPQQQTSCQGGKGWRAHPSPLPDSCQFTPLETKATQRAYSFPTLRQQPVEAHLLSGPGSLL